MAENLSIEVRTETGKGPARRLRVKGMVPGIFYGTGKAATPFSVDPKALVTALKAHGENTLLSLQASGSPLQGKVALLKDYQRDPASRALLHVDFVEVDMNKPVTVEVPLHLTGKAAGLAKGGIVDQIRHNIEVRCLPDRIPDSLDMDITGLDVGDSLHAKDIKLPEGVTLVSDGRFTIATVTIPAAEPTPAETAAAEAAAAAAAAGAEGAAPAAGAPAAGAAPAAPADTKGGKGK